MVAAAAAAVTVNHCCFPYHNRPLLFGWGLLLIATASATAFGVLFRGRDDDTGLFDVGGVRFFVEAVYGAVESRKYSVVSSLCVCVGEGKKTKRKKLCG